MKETKQSSDKKIDSHTVQEYELSLVDIWNIIWLRKWIWLTLGPIAGAIGILYALKLPNLYKAETILAASAEEKTGAGFAALAGQLGGIASMAGINVSGGSSTENALAVLRSRQFLIPFLAKEERLRELFPNEWDSNSKTWTVTKERRAADNRPTDLEAYEKFTNRLLSVSKDKKTNLVIVSLEMRNPQLAAIWTNQLIGELNTHLREQAIKETNLSLDYLNKQLSKTKVLEIRESLYSLIESQTKNAMLANAKEDYAFKVIDPAVTPETKSSPKRATIVIASGLFGGLLGLFLCFVLHFVESAKRSG